MTLGAHNDPSTWLSVQFEYGTTSGTFGQGSDTWIYYSLGDGGAWYWNNDNAEWVENPTISADIDGLASGTTYYFRGTASAFDENGQFSTYFGNELSFTTAVPEPSAWAAFAGVAALGLAHLRRNKIQS